jgi:chorismate--pyruvate lyase
MPLGCARWFSHINGVNPPPALRPWLTDRTSLTQKLIAQCGQFRVQTLRQENTSSLADEYQAVGLARRTRVQTREVLLRCDEEPVVFAHTIMPSSASASDWPFFGTLGQRSLGTTLFGDPRVLRGELEYARLRPQHPLARRARAAIRAERMESPVYARRCLFRRKNGLLLVTELFLPPIARLGPE